MDLRRLVRKLKLSLVGLVGGVAFACSGPTNPGEMPPLAPRPDPVQPASRDPESQPVPGARDPLAAPDAALTDIPAPSFQSSSEPMQKAPADAGVQDAVALPPSVPDAMPPDAARQPQAISGACC